MRIWLRPDKLAQLKLTPTDVANAISEQNAQFAAGRIGAEPTNPDKPVAINYMTGIWPPRFPGFPPAFPF